MQSVFEIFRGSLHLYTKQYKGFLPFLGYFFLIGIAARFLLDSWPFFASKGFVGTYAFLIIEVGLLLCQLLISLSMFRHTLALAQGKPTQAALATVLDTKKYLFSGLWVASLQTVCIVLGLLFLIIPGIILSITLLFSVIIFLDQNKRGLSALQASHALVSGKIPAILGKCISLILILMVLMTVVSYAIGYAVTIILSFTPILYSSSLTEFRSWLFTAISMIVALSFVPLTTTILVLLYEDTRRSKEMTMPAAKI